MEYNHKEIEARWQKIWSEEQTFKAENNSVLPKYYVLDMFPYPSGAGLHVGHPLGYIASDIYSRYKRHKGFNVLHPMGYDAFGLPAEQYAIQTGQHPDITTKNNIARYREQLDKIGFSFDWSREVRTCETNFYSWTQWIFKQFFNSWYNTKADKAESIDILIEHFKTNGTTGLNAAYTEELIFSADEWVSFDAFKKSEVLLNYRLAYRSESMVNWCPKLGTVLANDEVKDGVSERGGYPVVQKKMMQWSMRISAYAQRLLDGLDHIDWSSALKESQRNWIGRSEGASLVFKVDQHDKQIDVFTTRPDTVFGASFMTLAPEHEFVDAITTDEYREAVQAYKEKSARRSERDRMADTKTISGQFTGAYAVHPFSDELIPIWIGDYVLASYGTGAVMAVPGHDSRDWAFAKHFELPIKEVVSGGDISVEAFDGKEGTIVNSGFITGMAVADAVKAICDKAEEKGIGKAMINYRLRDAIFGRQRYWGEPIPVYYKNGIPNLIPDSDLPLELPAVDKYLPTEDGEPPLARAENWTYKGSPVETTTMPGWAGSSWYFLRYMDALNNGSFVGKEAVDYWGNVDLYIGGSEHATGHLLYARFWHKFFADMDLVNTQEPFKKLINQGMIQGISAFAYRVKGENKFVSKGLKDKYNTTAIHVDVSFVEGDVLNLDDFRNWRAEFLDATFELEDGNYIVGHEVEKMSKSKYNVVNPDNVIEQYGADVLRMYEMFLGPLEQSKPWNTQGLSGVNGFVKKFWRLYQGEISSEKANEKELKELHTCIKKVNEDIENFSFNTSISAFMICTNELLDLKCKKREILEPLAVLIAPFAPHIAEELWTSLGFTGGISKVNYPQHEEKFLVESTKNYPVSFNGKMRFTIALPLNMGKDEIEKAVLADERTGKYIDGKTIRKMIVVPGKIINIVIG